MYFDFGLVWLFNSGSQCWYLKPCALFIVSSLWFSFFKFLYDDAMAELMNHYANRKLAAFVLRITSKSRAADYP